MKSLQIEAEALEKLMVIKGFLGYKNMTHVIYALLQLSGYDKSFFARLEGMKKE